MILLAALDTLKPSYLSRTAFLKDLKAALKPTTVKLSAAATKLLQKHLGEHDDAEICKDAKGNIEANPDLRDYENVLVPVSPSTPIPALPVRPPDTHSRHANPSHPHTRSPNAIT